MYLFNEASSCLLLLININKLAKHKKNEIYDSEKIKLLENFVLAQNEMESHL